MKLSRTETGYVIEVPADVVEALGLREGDDVEVGRRERPVDDLCRDEIIDEIRRLARPLPPGYKFDREEANAR